MSLKDRISSPLEAGTSILHAHHLPPHLLPALEYVSDKLARRSLYLTLVVVRRDYQLPAVVPPCGSPGMQARPAVCSATAPGTPLSPRFAFAASPVSSLRQLVRSASGRRRRSPARLRIETQQLRGSMASPTPSFASSLASSVTPSSSSSLGRMSPRPQWPLSPAAMSPRTPCTPASAVSVSMTSTPASNDAANPFLAGESHGLRLVYAEEPSAREEKWLRTILHNARKKFRIGTEWLSEPMSSNACGLTSQLIQHSMSQNEVLFSSEGLALLALDALYSLKSALSAYTKTRSLPRLEDAVDELRRLVLAGNGRKISRSDLLRSYDWLCVSHAAIGDLDRMYRRAYGGPEGLGAITGIVPTPIRTVFVGGGSVAAAAAATPLEVQIVDDEDGHRVIERAGVQPPEDDLVPMMEAKEQHQQPLAVPCLPRLYTKFDNFPSESDDTDSDDEPNSNLTARPKEGLPAEKDPAWRDSIKQTMLISAGSGDSSPGQCPVTPNDYNDISPTTRGEWGYLMVDNSLGQSRTAAVERC